MKVTKHGKKFTKEQVNMEAFECDNCGCELLCKDDEYYVDYGGADSSSMTVSTTYFIMSTVRDYYVCSCPECHKIIKKVKERKNQNYYRTSLTGSEAQCNADKLNVNCDTTPTPKAEKN